MFVKLDALFSYVRNDVCATLHIYEYANKLSDHFDGRISFILRNSSGFYVDPCSIMEVCMFPLVQGDLCEVVSYSKDLSVGARRLEVAAKALKGRLEVYDFKALK